MKILLKQGELGSSMFFRDEETNEVKEIHKPAYDFKDFPELSLIDTTGAGDCFTGAFTMKYLEGASYEECLTFGNQAGFLCITKYGAGPAIPSIDDIQATFNK